MLSRSRPREYVRSGLNQLDALTVLFFLLEMALQSVLPIASHGIALHCIVSHRIASSACDAV